MLQEPKACKRRTIVPTQPKVDALERFNEGKFLKLGASEQSVKYCFINTFNL